MFSFESRNGKMYDVLSYDNERDLTLLHEINDSMENTYLVVENMKNNGLIWAKEHSFTNYKEAHDYFVTEVYNTTLDYKEQFRNVLKQEEVNLDGINFDILYAYFIEDDSTSGFIDRQYIEDLISDVKKQERQEKIEKAHPFIDDKEKMRDFHVLSKEEFLNTYSYITDEEYESTQRAVGKGLHLTNESLNKTILESTIAAFEAYRIVLPEDKTDKGIYIAYIGDSEFQKQKMTYQDMQSHLKDENDTWFNTTYYSSYKEALNEWLSDISVDIYDIGLFSNADREYNFYLTPEELQYCGLEKQIQIEVEKLEVDEKIQLAHDTSNSVLLDIFAKDTNSSIRLEVAKNRNASHETLNELALDSSKEISQNAQKTEIAKNNTELEHIKKFFENDRVEYFIYHHEKQELQVIWFNEEGNDGLGTIRVDTYPFEDMLARKEKGVNHIFYANSFYDENYDKFQHELITDLSKIDDLLLGNNAIKINSDTLTIDDVIKTIYSSNKETNLSEVKQEIEKILDNNPHVNYTITLTNLDNLKESYQCYGYHSFDIAIQEAKEKLYEHSSNHPFRAVLNVTTYEELHPTFGTPIDEKVVYTKDISSLLFEKASIDLTQMKQDIFLILAEEKKGLSHIKGLGTTSERSSSSKEKNKEQEL